MFCHNSLLVGSLYHNVKIYAEGENYGRCGCGWSLGVAVGGWGVDLGCGVGGGFGMWVWGWICGSSDLIATGLVDFRWT